jgi:type I restriction enzyme S subunit
MDKVNIPKHWKLVKLGEYVDSVKGKKPRRVESEISKECSVPYVNIKAFEKKIIENYTDGIGCVICEENDFLMVWDGSRSGYVGKAIKGALGSTLVKLNFPNVNNNFAYYFLQSKYLEINTRAKGVGIPHVDPNLLWNYKFPIPPLPEQQAIVSRIEELLSDLDNGKQQLQLAQQQLKTYRQSLLKWAFEGKLTNQNVKDGVLPKGWKWVNPEVIAAKEKYSIGIGPFGSNLKVSDYKPSGVPLIFVKNITKRDFSLAPRFITKQKLNELHPHSVKALDILITKMGDPPGDCAIYPESFPEAVITSDCLKLRVNENVANRKYIYYALQTQLIKRQFELITKGVAQKKISLQRFKSILIPIPELQEQHLIVSELESKLTVCDKIEETISQSLLQAESLRQSILKQAFEGKLV